MNNYRTTSTKSTSLGIIRKFIEYSFKVADEGTVHSNSSVFNYRRSDKEGVDNPDKIHKFGRTVIII